MHDTGMRTHARVLETMKGKFSALKLRFGMNLTSSGGHSTPIFSITKAIHGTFSRDTENPKGKPKIH